jgi:hypothetical protein
MTMPDVDIDAELKKRKQARDDRMREIRKAAEIPMVTVTPTKPEYRKYLKHAGSGVGFKEDGPAIWPHDQFTKRRIKDGAIKIEEDKNGKSKEAKPQAVAGAPRQPA